MADTRKTRGPVDWAEVRARIEAAAAATVPSPERVRRLLEERARVLARPAIVAPAGDTLRVITFALSDEVYAIESRFVISVFRLREFSPLPGAKPPVFGITAWRGDLLTILDLRAVLGLSVSSLNDLSRVIVIGEDRPAFGILADSVREFVELPASAVRDLPDAAAGRAYLRGVTSDAVLVLDGEKIRRLDT